MSTPSFVPYASERAGDAAHGGEQRYASADHLSQEKPCRRHRLEVGVDLAVYQDGVRIPMRSQIAVVERLVWADFPNDELASVILRVLVGDSAGGPLDFDDALFEKSRRRDCAD